MSNKNKQNKNVKPNTSNKSDKDSTVEIAKINRTTTIVTTIVGALFTLTGVIVTAVFASPFLTEYYQKNFQPSPTPILFGNTPTDAVITFTDTPFFEVIETETPTPSQVFVIDYTPTPSPTQAATSMKAQIIYNYGAGKAPVQGSFNAHSSFVTFTDGTTADCTYKNVCSFTWDVRLDNKTIYGPIIEDGNFSFNFQKKGDYTVVVYVCRGDVCNFAAVSMNIR